MKQAMWFWQIFFISPLMAMKTNRSNPSDISDIMVKSTFEDLKDLADMPNLGANSNDAIAMHSIGRLAANMEFLMNKETVVELQQIELKKVSGCCAQATAGQFNQASFLQTKGEQRQQDGSREAETKPQVQYDTIQNPDQSGGGGESGVTHHQRNGGGGTGIGVVDSAYDKATGGGSGGGGGDLWTWPKHMTGAMKSLMTLAEDLANCPNYASSRNSASRMVICLGNLIIKRVPPFNLLEKLGDILSDFLGGFAKVAGTVAGKVLKGGSSLIQEAALSKFPAVGASPLVHHSGHSLVIKTHSRKNQMKAKMSTLQMRGDDDPPNDGISFNLHDEGSNYQSKLVTQFHGYEKDTSSCLAFAPKSKHGANGQATEADWQVQNEDTFVALEPWAVPCGNDWMKRNWDKWQGYSFYMGESAIEKCMTVTYGINVQPVVAFVGGLQVDVMPEPLASVDTTVCWPDGRPDGQDLSLLRTEIKSSGVLLFGRSLRLSKRFGSPTHMVGEYTHASTGTWQGSTNPQQEISRTKLLQTSQNETRQAASGEDAAQEDQGVLEWMEEEDVYLASANYSDLGMNLTSELRGAAAARHLSLASTRAQGGFELFNFAFDASGMVNFRLRALLAGTSLEMRTEFGFTSLLNLNSGEQIAIISIVELVDHTFQSMEKRAKGADFQLFGVHRCWTD
ncbi:unnamed protein product [Symbiodinium microadriaticum]|nr:unnamed protein product [Symbiodinium microadriaticum]